MKRCAIATGCLMAAVAAYAQGTISFSNRDVQAGVNAPVFDATGNRLAGSDFVAELWAGPSADSLELVSDLISFQTGVLAGYINGGTCFVPGVGPGQSAAVEVRVWRFGAGETYELARASNDPNPLGNYGSSGILMIMMGGPLSPPASLAALTSITLKVAVPSDTTPPTIVKVTGSDTFTQVTVEFSEAVTNTALVAFNYALSGGLVISGVTRISTATVLLTTSIQTPDTLYVLTVNNITDLAGNPIAANSTVQWRSFVLPGLSNKFADRQTVSTSSFSITGSNLGFTRETDEPYHANKIGSTSAWLQWQVPSSGVAIITTVGSDFDTLLGIYTGSSLPSLQYVTSDDDGGGNLSSRAVFPVQRGQVLEIAVDGFQGASGKFVLNIELVLPGTQFVLSEIHRNPSSPSVVTGAAVTLSADVLSFPSQTTVQYQYQWFHNGKPIPNAVENIYVIANTQSTNVGGYVLQVTLSTNGVFLTSTSSGPAIIQINTAGETNTAATDKFADFAVPGVPPQRPALLAKRRLMDFTVTAPTAFATGYSGSQIFDNSCVNASSSSTPPCQPATTENNEPPCCGRVALHSMWYGYQPQQDGILTLSAQSSFTNILDVFVWPEQGGPQLVTNRVIYHCQSTNSTVSIYATNTVGYYIAVGTPDDNTGQVALQYSMQTNSPPVAHDVPRTLSEDSPTTTIQLSASDPEGATLTYQIARQPSHGHLGPIVGNTVGYTPDLNYNGPDSFTFKVNDGKLDSSPATVSITVTPVNDPPVFGDYPLQVTQGGTVALPVASILASATDPENGVLTVQAFGPLAHGTISTNAAGTSISYQHDGSEMGDSFTCTIIDNGTPVGTATAHINVSLKGLIIRGVPPPPGLSLNEDQLLKPFSNVTFLDQSNPAALTVTVRLQEPNHGILRNLGQLQFQPVSGDCGAYQFTGSLTEAAQAIGNLGFIPAKDQKDDGPFGTTLIITASNQTADPPATSWLTVTTTAAPTLDRLNIQLICDQAIIVWGDGTNILFSSDSVTGPWSDRSTSVQAVGTKRKALREPATQPRRLYWLKP